MSRSLLGQRALWHAHTPRTGARREPCSCQGSGRGRRGKQGCWTCIGRTNGESLWDASIDTHATASLVIVETPSCVWTLMPPPTPRAHMHEDVYIAMRFSQNSQNRFCSSKFRVLESRFNKTKQHTRGDGAFIIGALKKAQREPRRTGAHLAEDAANHTGYVTQPSFSFKHIYSVIVRAHLTSFKHIYSVIVRAVFHRRRWLHFSGGRGWATTSAPGGDDSASRAIAK